MQFFLNFHLLSLTKEFNLPTDFLVEQMTARVGSIIQGFKDQADPKVYAMNNYSLSVFMFVDEYVRSKVLCNMAWSLLSLLLCRFFLVFICER